MAPNYDWVARELFPNAYQVADKFHVVKNIIDQVQSVRIRYRQELLRKQRELEEASRKQPKLQPDPKIQREFKDLKKELSNGDTQLQLLQRSKGLLHKLPNEHTASQKLRARLLFRLFPDIKEAYKFSVALRKWYQRPMRNGTSITPSRQNSESFLPVRSARFCILVFSSSEQRIRRKQVLFDFLSRFSLSVFGFILVCSLRHSSR